MPRGKYIIHKGRNRSFTSPEKLQQEEQSPCDSDYNESEYSDDNDIMPRAIHANKIVSKTRTKSDDSGSNSNDEKTTRGNIKGVEALIEIQNPNRLVKKNIQKLVTLSLDDVVEAPELTRREREEIKKQKARQRYEKQHTAAKTQEAKSDLARLALVRKQREEAAAKRENEKKTAEAKKESDKRNPHILRKVNQSMKVLTKPK